MTKVIGVGCAFGAIVWCPIVLAQTIGLELENVDKNLPPMAQVTSVSQLSDVQPTDWAFSALQSLVERYGCIAGYPDRTYRGQRPLSRYEFAAGLNACLTKINELVAAGLADKVNKDDLAILQRLQEEFAAEVAAVKGRLDSLEKRVTSIEGQQFSTVAKLGGEVVFGLAGATGAPTGNSNPNVVFPYVARLQVVASFTGNDRLRIGLQSANFGTTGSNAALGFGRQENLNTQMALLSYQSSTDNNFAIENLEYRFPAFDDRVVFTIRPAGFSLGSVLTPNSPYFDTGRGAISRFAEASPLFKIGNLQSGVGFDWLLSDQARLQFAYGTRNSADPRTGGITGAENSALGVQLLTKPADTVWAGIGYINAYSARGELATLTGSFNADNPGILFSGDPRLQATQTNAISGTLNWAISPTLRLGAWGGWTFSNSVNSSAYANSTTYLFSLGLSDPFGRQGDVLAFLFGQPPRLTEGRTATGATFSDPAVGLHYEVFYRYRLDRNISITPGFFFVTNPNHVSGRDTIFVGTIRTVFRF
ncbi:MAG: iron uptake porin [Pseudanabaenaceae cyanobacterium SKYGB_i_bin29]|nr:iron uptake porin [Pseudanabaenaceae cyanobacterium SKYG29]MDW8421003.1 iron uptake porin [Pseudanabaenaceae cyanobacterium SKYGB_i_bin29]